MVEYHRVAEELSQHLGIVIPVYVPADIEPEEAGHILEETVVACMREVQDPEVVCLSADGGGFSSQVAEDVAERHSLSLVTFERNVGKLHAVRLGAAHLIERAVLSYIAVVDMDGDHFPNELMSFLRAAAQVKRLSGNDRVLVLGRRISRHRPLGFLRGELEELADRVLLDALHYDACRTAKPLELQFTTSLDEFPDFHSGYKLFSREAARDVLLTEPQMAGVSEEAYYRHAVEAVMVVEAVKRGAVLVEVNRSSFDEQVISTFGLLDRIELFKNKIVWPSKRLEVPAHFVAQWIDNHMPRLLLGSFAPEGPRELIELRRRVLLEMGMSEEAIGDDDAIVRSRFL
jgi:hypothetical protein